MSSPSKVKSIEVRSLYRTSCMTPLNSLVDDMIYSDCCSSSTRGDSSSISESALSEEDITIQHAVRASICSEYIPLKTGDMHEGTSCSFSRSSSSSRSLHPHLQASIGGNCLKCTFHIKGTISLTNARTYTHIHTYKHLKE